MLESLWAIRFLKVSDAEAPEDVKTTLEVLVAAALVPYAALFWGLMKGTPVLRIAKRYGVSKELVEYRIKVTLLWRFYKRACK
jgi:hypothetical protein